MYFRIFIPYLYIDNGDNIHIQVHHGTSEIAYQIMLTFCHLPLKLKVESHNIRTFTRINITGLESVLLTTRKPLYIHANREANFLLSTPQLVFNEHWTNQTINCFFLLTRKVPRRVGHTILSTAFRDHRMFSWNLSQILTHIVRTSTRAQ